MKKVIVGISFFFLLLIFFKSGLLDYLHFNELKARQSELEALYHQKPFFISLSYFIIYIVVTAFSLPGATVLTLGAGAIFGLSKGVLVVSFASTIGASLAFLLSRYLLKNLVEQKFSSQIKVLNQGVKKDGAFYLLSLRLVPLFPFFVVNLIMGLTGISLFSFYVVSQIGMLLGTIIYVYAGTHLASIQNVKDVLSINSLISLSLIGFFPLVTKKVIEFLKAKKVYKNFKKPERFDYNVLVIGAGAAGLVTSYIVSALKGKVALIEKEKMGGECLNAGCVPSKAFIKVSRVLQTIKKAQKYGIHDIHYKLSFEDVKNRVKDVIEEIAPHDSMQRYESLGVDCISGEAEILSPWEIRVHQKVLKTKNIVIATGSKPIIPQIPGLDKISYHTSETIWSLEYLPRKLLIVGSGAITCELSQAFSRMGVKTTIVSLSSNLLPKEDEDVSLEVQKTFKDEGINLFLGCENLNFKKEVDEQSLSFQSGEMKEVVEFDELLIATGRRANKNIPGVEVLGLDEGVHGTFDHDEYLRTKFPNVYVCGDCAGPYQLSHIAGHQAWYAAVNALLSPLKKFKVDYRIVPWVVYSDPEIARVGVSEKEAIKRKIDFEVTKYYLKDLDRAITEGETNGFVKILTRKGSDQIIGAAIVGSHAGDLIGELVIAMKMKIGMNKILSFIHPYPSFSEAIKHTAGQWKRNHKPERVLKIIEKFHKLRLH